jgi:hypothetical protein
MKRTAVLWTAACALLGCSLLVDIDKQTMPAIADSGSDASTPSTGDSSSSGVDAGSDAVDVSTPYPGLYPQGGFDQRACATLFAASSAGVWSDDASGRSGGSCKLCKTGNGFIYPRLVANLASAVQVGDKVRSRVWVLWKKGGSGTVQSSMTLKDSAGFDYSRSPISNIVAALAVWQPIDSELTVTALNGGAPVDVSFRIGWDDALDGDCILVDDLVIEKL